MGNVPGGVGARRPGPLRFGWWLLADTAATTAVKTLKMPKPSPDNKTKIARAVPWSLGKDKPAPGDIRQRVLANCQLAAILAALANTASGRPRISALVDEHPATVLTDLSDVLDELAPPEGNKPKVTAITSNRYFTVTLARGSAEVSDVFYTDEATSGWSMIYMDSPNKAGSEHLWPCVIEKGYAVLLGNDYDKLNSMVINGKPYLPAEEVWTTVVGKKPDILGITQDTDLSTIQARFTDAPQIPTIAASAAAVTAKKLMTSHGYAVLRLSGDTITLYDPDQAANITVSLKTEFRSNFQAILSGNP
jgi:hypothetical protein